MQLGILMGVILLLGCVFAVIWGYIYNSVLPFKISKSYFEGSPYEEIKQYHLKFKECGINHTFQKFSDGFAIFVRGDVRFDAIQCADDKGRLTITLGWTHLNIELKNRRKICFTVWQTLDSREWVIGMETAENLNSPYPLRAPFSGVVDVRNLLKIGGVYRFDGYGDLMICGFSNAEGWNALYSASIKCAKDFLDGKFNKEVRCKNEN